MKPYSSFVAMYGYLPNVRGMDKGQAEIGLLMNINKAKYQRILEYTMGVSGAFSGEAYLSLLEMSGASDKIIQDAEIDMIKNKASADNAPTGAF